MSKPRPKTTPKPLPETKPAGSVPAWSSATCRVIGSLVLVGLVMAVYWPVTGFDFINYDDQDYVTENYHVLAGLTWPGVAWAFTTEHAGNWHPLTWLSHMLDCQWFGLHAGGHHFVNLLFHAANAALLFLLLGKITNAVWRAAFVAALFALHPLHVESVAWISERKDVLSTFFGLGSLICYARAVTSGQWQATRTDSSRSLVTPYYWLALLFFALGLMSKPMLVTWPLVMLLLDYWPLRRNRGWKSLLVEKIPFFALSAISCGVTFMAQRAGGMVIFKASSLWLRTDNALIAYARYLGKTFWPVNLANPYPYPASWPWVQVLGAGLLIAGLSVLAVRLRTRWPFIFVGWFWFLGMLVPVIGLVQVGTQSLADRYAYVPLVGLFILLTWGAGEMAARRPALKIILGVAGTLILAAGAFRTSNQISHWRNSGTLFHHAIAVTKDNDIAYLNLGNYFLENGRLNEAIDTFHQALETARLANAAPAGAERMRVASTNGGVEFFRLDPEKGYFCAQIFNNLGTALAGKGQTEKAMEYYRNALRFNPDNALALYNLGFVLAEKKQYDQAIELFEKALRLKPDEPDFHDALGNSLAAAGKGEAAIEQYNEALKVAPGNARIQNDLGLALAAAGRAGEAVSHYEAALRADPAMVEVHNNLGSTLVNLGKLDEAIQQFRLLLQLLPGHQRAHENLGIALASEGRLDEAIVELREASRLQPDNGQTCFNLGNVLALQGNLKEAEKSFTEAIRLQPDLAPAHCNLGSVLVQLGRRDEGIAQFREALRLNPKYEPAREQLRGLGVNVP